MTDKKPTLKLNLSGDALKNLQAKIPKAPKVVESKKATAKSNSNKQKGKSKSKVTEEQILNSPFDVNQYFFMLKKLQKNNPQTFPPKDRPAVAFAVGINKDIAKIFGISNKKAFYFCRMYCGTKRYKEAISKSGSPRYNLEGKKVGNVD